MNKLRMLAFVVMGCMVGVSSSVMAEDIVVNDPKNGSVKQVEAWFKSNFKDISSRETIEWSKVDK